MPDLNDSSFEDKDVKFTNNLPETVSPSNGFSKRQFVVLFLTLFGNLFIQMSYSILAAFYPDEATNKGATQTDVGLLFTVFEFGIVLSAPIFGRYLNHLGSKFSFVTGLMCTGCISASYGVLHYCPDGGIYLFMCFLLRVFDSLFASLFLTAAYAIVPKEFPDNVASITGLMELCQGLGFTLGPPIGGFLYQSAGILVPFVVQGGILIMMGSLAFAALPSYQDEEAGEGAPLSKFLRLPAVWITGAAVFSAAASIGCTEPTLEKRLDDFHLSHSQVGLMFLLMSAFYALPAPLLGKFSEKLGVSRSMVFFGLLLSAASACFLGPLPFIKSRAWKHSLWMTGISLASFGLFSAVAIVPTYDMLVTAALDSGMEENFSTYGLVAGFFMSAYSLGASAGPLYAGFVMEHLGFSWVMFVTACLLLTTSMLVLAWLMASRCAASYRADPERAPLLNPTLSSPVVDADSGLVNRG